MNRSQHPIEQEELMAFLDGELSADRATNVAAHLRDCGECRAAIAESRGLSERLTAWQVEAAPPSIAARVKSGETLREIDPQGVGKLSRSRPRFLFPNWVWAAAGGLCLLLVVAVVSLPTLHRSHDAAESAAMISQSGQMMTYLPAVKKEPNPREEKNIPGGGAGRAVELGPPVAIPMIARTASLTLESKDFDKTRESLEELVRRHRGYSAQLTVATQSGNEHKLTATFRVPADQLDATIAELKHLAHVEQESQGGEEVTDQYVDLQARLSNARRTEQALLEILEKHTGQLSDVLEVEKELARVREEIERMDAELKNLQSRVSFATLQVELSEEYKAQLELPPSLGGRLRNAVVEGFRTAAESLVGLVMFVLTYGPVVFLWVLVLLWPVRFVWRRVRKEMGKELL